MVRCRRGRRDRRRSTTCGHRTWGPRERAGSPSRSTRPRANDFLIVDGSRRPVPSGPSTSPGSATAGSGVGADGVIRLSAGAAARLPVRPRERRRHAGRRCAGTGCGARGPSCTTVGGRRATSFDARHAGRCPRTSRSTLRDGRVAGATVAMGTPNFTKAAIPMAGPAWETFREQPFDVGRRPDVPGHGAHDGQPAPRPVRGEEPERYHVEHIGPAIEHDDAVPRAHQRRVRARARERDRRARLGAGRGGDARLRLAVRARSRWRRTRPGWRPAASRSASRAGRSRSSAGRTARSCLGGPVAHVFDGTADPEAPVTVPAWTGR